MLRLRGSEADGQVSLVGIELETVAVTFTAYEEKFLLHAVNQVLTLLDVGLELAEVFLVLFELGTGKFSLL